MKIGQNTGYRLSAAAIFSLCAILSGCGNIKLNSDWRGREIIIDGKYRDWGNAQSYYDEKEKIIVNLLNDKDYLYICLISRSIDTEARLMESGFIAWFDPDSGKDKTFGVRFPIGLKEMGISLGENGRKIDADWQDQEDNSGLIDREKERLRSRDFQERLQVLEGLQDKLEILTGPLGFKGKDKEADKPLELSLEEAGKLGIEAKVGRENGYFVYELKVPLAKTDLYLYAIQVKAGKPIGLGLEIPQGKKMMDGPGDRKPEREDPAGHGMYSADTFQLWATVTLAGI